MEPMQRLVKDKFDPDRCCMHGNDNNRWLFATMGLLFKSINSMLSRKNDQLGK